MAATFSPSPLLNSAASVATASLPSKPTATPPLSKPPATTLAATLAAAAAAAAVLAATPLPSLAADPAYRVYYGTASSAANYGGYGGNSSKKDAAEYVYDVPEGWKERLVSKVEKGTNGTDSEFYNPARRSEREYLTFLAGFQRLVPSDIVLNNLALSDVELQDLIAGAESVRSEERKDENGQVYYVYEIDGGGAGGAHSLISVTCAKNKLYAHFVNAPAAEWGRDEGMLRHLHESFKTVSF